MSPVVVFSSLGGGVGACSGNSSSKSEAMAPLNFTSRQGVTEYLSPWVFTSDLIRGLLVGAISFNYGPRRKFCDELEPRRNKQLCWDKKGVCHLCPGGSEWHSPGAVWPDNSFCCF